MREQFRIVPAEERDQIDHVRTLFLEYASSLGFGLAGQLLLALCDSVPAGCVALRKLEDGICEMKRLYIRPEFRGRGLGRDLVLALVEQARQSMYGKLRGGEYSPGNLSISASKL